MFEDWRARLPLANVPALLERRREARLQQGRSRRVVGSGSRGFGATPSDKPRQRFHVTHRLRSQSLRPAVCLVQFSFVPPCSNRHLKITQSASGKTTKSRLADGSAVSSTWIVRGSFLRENSSELRRPSLERCRLIAVW